MKGEARRWEGPELGFRDNWPLRRPLQMVGRRTISKRNRRLNERRPTLTVSTLPEKERFTPTEAAKYLEVSKPTIYRWIESGKLKAVLVGEKLLKIPREAIMGAQKEVE